MAQQIHWESVGNGRLALWGRPGLRSLSLLKAGGCDRVVTLLSAQEGGEALGQAVIQAQLAWTWMPLSGATPPSGAASSQLQVHLDELSDALDHGESLLIHCAAGIHRTGMVAYALLRRRGLAVDAARNVLEQLRATTATGMHAEHYAWGDAQHD